jgi:transposase-like protein
MKESYMQVQEVEMRLPPLPEGERSEPGGGGGSGALRRPDPEVSSRAKRRRFTAEYKARIVREAEACTEFGQISALLRREGLYSSTLSKWRQSMRYGAMAGLDKKRGRTKDPDTELRQQVRQLERENARLKRQLQQAAMVIEVQKKVSEILKLPLEPESEDDES